VRTVIGVDLGGTNVRAEAIGPSGERLGNRLEMDSMAQAGVDACVDAICRAIAEAREGIDAEAVGLAVPGHIQDPIVRWAPNFGRWDGGRFHHWQDVPLGSRVQAEIGLRVVMGNDANLAALGEYRFGVGKNSANGLVLLTLGTGIGCGVVLAPRCVSGGLARAAVLIGGNGGGAELGHMVIVKDGDPHPSAVGGTLEAYCNKDAIVRRGAARLSADCPEALAEITEGRPAELTPRHLAQLADAGNPAAAAALAETGEYLGVGIANIINIFAPEIVALGGQIAKTGSQILEPARRSAERYSIPTLFADTKIVIAEQIDDAGILGAAALAFEAQT